MKFLTGAFACGLMIAGFATSAPVQAAELCSNCIAHYNACMAAGGNSQTCWSCNNVTCIQPTAQDRLQDALTKLTTKKSTILAPATRHTVVTQLDS